MPHSTNLSPAEQQQAASSSAMRRATSGGASQQPRPRRLPSLHYPPDGSDEPSPASLDYMRKLREAMDHQRQAFEEERAMWKIERSELHRRIRFLEKTIQRLQSAGLNPLLNIDFEQEVKEEFKQEQEIKQEEETDPPSRQQPLHSSSSISSTGSEIWRGSNPSQNPTRTFSQSSSSSNKPRRLASVAESSSQPHVTSPPARRVSINPLPENITHHQSVSGAAIDRNLDGINFKSSGLAPDILEKVMSESPSPRSSPAVVPPTTASEEAVSPLTLPTLGVFKRDPYTMDAGHTPLARGRPHPLSAVDGMTSTGHLSGGVSTPTALPKDQAQPQPGGGDAAEDRMESVQPPSERRDSYFPVAQDEEPLSPDPDPELKGPLGLTSDAVGEGGGNDDFLKELNSKLMHVEEREENSSEADTDMGMNDSNEDANKGAKRKQEGREEHGSFEQPEHEPRLRLKRSMNFGSQLGGNKVGRGF